MNRLLQSCVGNGAAGMNPGTTSGTAGDGSVNGVPASEHSEKPSDAMITATVSNFSRGCSEAMTGRRAALVFVLAVLVSVAVAAPAGAQAARTWVSGVGDDANPCSRTAPCKTLAGSISKTAAGGEINALDPGGYGAVTITKAITIDLTTIGSGGLLNASTNGVNVSAGAGDDVVLRGLDINGASQGGSANCSYGGLNGIRVLGAGSVRIEDSTISRTRNAGIALTADNTNLSVFVNRVDIDNSCEHGINAAPAAGRTVDVMVRDSTITNAGTGVRATAGAHAWLSGTSIFGNALGVDPAGGVIDSLGGNSIVGNVVDGTPTHTLPDGAPGPQGPAGPQGGAGPQGPAGPAGEPATRLRVALPSARLTSLAGRRLTVRYLATANATSTMFVRRAGKTIAKVNAPAHRGINRIVWNGKAGKRTAKPGRYKLTLRAAGADGQHHRASARLTVRAPR
jgi:Periplasmic copper-binding protein (NosD)